MRKSLRNAALRDSTRLITATYEDEDWYSDAYFATKYPILEGYKVKKSQEYAYVEGKPDITPIIGEATGYIQAEKIKQSDIGEDFVQLYTGKINAVIKKAYLDLLIDIYPDSKVYINEQDKRRPVRVYDGGEIVAVIMPVW